MSDLNIPDKIIAGDTFKITENIADYPSSLCFLTACVAGQPISSQLHSQPLFLTACVAGQKTIYHNINYKTIVYTKISKNT